MSIRPLLAGNWKMNGLTASLETLDQIADGLSPPIKARVDVALCPPFTLIAAFAARKTLSIGGQDCHPSPNGAHTGDIAAEMLKDAGASHVIVGHSERRTNHGETNALVAAKAAAAHRTGLTAIVCIGETEAERDAGQTLNVVATQLMESLPSGTDAANTVIAYEPVWAIGTGRTPTLDDVALVHGRMRALLEQRFGPAGSLFKLLYGGSVKATNAKELMAVRNVNGALVGGASLKAAEFLELIHNAYG